MTFVEKRQRSGHEYNWKPTFSGSPSPSPASSSNDPPAMVGLTNAAFNARLLKGAAPKIGEKKAVNVRRMGRSLRCNGIILAYVCESGVYEEGSLFEHTRGGRCECELREETAPCTRPSTVNKPLLGLRKAR